ncbi:MAG: hypothetical protein ACPGWM_06060, partial [Flavobacteriales bacterium]
SEIKTTMKRTTTICFSLLFAMLLLLAAGCKKEEDENSSSRGSNGSSAGNPPNENVLSATIDGEVIDFTETMIFHNISVAGTTIFVEGNSSDGSSISLQLSSWDESLGSWEISASSSSPDANMLYFDSDSDPWVCPAFGSFGNPAVSVDLAVSYYDVQSIRGTFSGEFVSPSGTGMIAITNGNFAIEQF